MKSKTSCAAVRCWLVKQEPAAYSFAQFQKDKKTAWTGVRNFQARNNLRAMQKGDPVLYYHSNDDRAIVGLAEVAKAAYPDPTATEGDWSCVDLKAVRPFAKSLALPEIKADAKLKDIALIRQSRLSVMPITPDEFAHILKRTA
ncbi:MAG: ubiquinol-cytochrome C reductase [Verrucomicrobia bacterium Tous-C9LFEB]|nr:MAG: ubiquinol-cytochrome C reductase [Verrucomicrobia bacterium Tous-C9LFEB]